MSKRINHGLDLLPQARWRQLLRVLAWIGSISFCKSSSFVCPIDILVSLIKESKTPDEGGAKLPVVGLHSAVYPLIHMQGISLSLLVSNELQRMTISLLAQWISADEVLQREQVVIRELLESVAAGAETTSLPKKCSRLMSMVGAQKKRCSLDQV